MQQILIAIDLKEKYSYFFYFSSFYLIKTCYEENLLVAKVNEDM